MVTEILHRRDGDGDRNDRTDRRAPTSRRFEHQRAATAATGSSTGRRRFVTNGATADLVVVAARTSRRGISLFGVEADMAGFARGPNLAKLGQHEAGTSELFFDDVRVPDENRIGEIDRGFGHMMDNLPQERLSSAALNLAHAAVALEATLEYVRERHAFGRPIGSFQHNRFVLAELSTAIDVAQAFVDRCISAHVSGTLLPTDAAKAKWWTSEVQNRVIDACLQLHGGYGYMEEYEICSVLGGRARHEDLGRLERDHEGDHRP